MENKGKLHFEKRQHERVHKQYDVRYKLMPKDMAVQPLKVAGKSRDISIGGIRVEGEPCGQEKDVIRLEIDTGKPGESIIVFAEIRWVKKGKEAGGEIGLKFLALREEDIGAIQKLASDQGR